MAEDKISGNEALTQNSTDDNKKESETKNINGDKKNEAFVLLQAIRIRLLNITKRLASWVKTTQKHKIQAIKTFGNSLVNCMKD